MKIRAGFEIAYDCAQPTPMILQVSVHPSRQADLITWDGIKMDPPIPANTYHDTFGNFCHVIRAPAGRLILSTDFLAQDSGKPDEVVRGRNGASSGGTACRRVDLPARQPLLRDRPPGGLRVVDIRPPCRKAGRWSRRSVTSRTSASNSATSTRARARRPSMPSQKGAACAAITRISPSRCAAA